LRMIFTLAVRLLWSRGQKGESSAPGEDGLKELHLGRIGLEKWQLN